MLPDSVSEPERKPVTTKAVLERLTSSISASAVTDRLSVAPVAAKSPRTQPPATRVRLAKCMLSARKLMLPVACTCNAAPLAMPCRLSHASSISTSPVSVPERSSTSGLPPKSRTTVACEDDASEALRKLVGAAGTDKVTLVLDKSVASAALASVKVKLLEPPRKRIAPAVPCSRASSVAAEPVTLNDCTALARLALAAFTALKPWPAVGAWVRLTVRVRSPLPLRCAPAKAKTQDRSALTANSVGRFAIAGVCCTVVTMVSTEAWIVLPETPSAAATDAVKRLSEGVVMNKRLAAEK